MSPTICTGTSQWNVIIAAVKRKPGSRSQDTAREFKLTSNIFEDLLDSLDHLRKTFVFIQLWIKNWWMARDQRAKDELSLRNVLWGGEACSAHKGVFSVGNKHPWMRNNSRAIRERQYQFLCSVKCWAGIIGESSRAHICYLTGSALNDIWIFRKLFHHGCSKFLP
jgi:hypothetical protein